MFRDNFIAVPKSFRCHAFLNSIICAYILFFVIQSFHDCYWLLFFSRHHLKSFDSETQSIKSSYLPSLNQQSACTPSCQQQMLCDTHTHTHARARKHKENRLAGSPSSVYELILNWFFKLLYI